MPVIPFTQLYLDKLTRQFTIVQFSEDNDYSISVPYSEMIQVSFDDMKTRGLQLIAEDLMSYPKRISKGPSQYENLKEAELQGLQRRNKIVSITLQRAQELWIDPMHWIKNSKHMIGGPPEERQIVKLTEGQEAFFNALCAALEIAD